MEDTNRKRNSSIIRSPIYLNNAIKEVYKNIYDTPRANPVRQWMFGSGLWNMVSTELIDEEFFYE